jgi:hypothetical protein
MSISAGNVDARSFNYGLHVAQDRKMLAMPGRDPFAFKNSAFDAFLYANVGTELNGLELTILSILARLGKDPWAEAAALAYLPRAAAIDCLAGSISVMPLRTQPHPHPKATAARLLTLLPSKAQLARQNAVPMPASSPRKSGIKMSLVYCIMIMGLAFHIVLLMKFSPEAGSSIKATNQPLPSYAADNRATVMPLVYY